MTAVSAPMLAPQNAPTPPPPLRLLSRDTPQDVLSAAGTVLANAFKTEQLSRLINHAVPGLDVARLTSTVTTGVLDLEAYVVEDESTGDEKKILGVMVVKPPGFPHRGSPNANGPHAQAATALAAQAPHLDVEYAKLKKAVAQLEEDAFGPQGVTDTYYISHIGVEPYAQGRGIGKAFCEYMARRGAEEGIPVTLLTMSAGHVSYYERFGFKTRGYMEVEISGEVTKWWAMSTEMEASNGA